MPVLKSEVDTASSTYLDNHHAQSAAVAALHEQLMLVAAGGGQRYAQRHHDRGKLLVRERIELLIDRDAPFLELSALAAWGTEFNVGAAIVTGLGVISGIECMIIAHDPTVRGGTMNPYTLRKNLRALEIARINRLPVVYLVESGGADLPTQAELFVHAGRIFHELTEMSAMGIATIALVFGNSTAGGAYVPGMCDYAVLVDRAAKVFLGGPPLVKMATGEDADDEALGGADMHSRTSGLADYFAIDETDAIRIGRDIVAHLNWRKLGPGPTQPADEPLYDTEELLGIASGNPRIPFDPREVIARIVDGSRFSEYKPRWGTSIATGWASIHGFPVGILANTRGVLFSEEAKKATEFILLANQTDTPLIFLHNVTGFMVGTEYEQGGIIKDGAKMINAVTNSDVPHISINMGGSFGAGNYGMSGRAYDPRFMFTWANARLAVMGAQQLAGVLSIVGKAAAESAGREFDAAADAERTAAIERQIEDESHPFFISARLYDDGVIDPRDTRAVLGISLSAAHSATVAAAAASASSGCEKSVRTTTQPAAKAQSPAITKLLIANRGEIASRIIRTARQMDIATVALYSDADRDAPYVLQADESVHLPGTAPADTYLRADLVLAAARRTGADAVHPGYGFLSENEQFARDCAGAGVIFVGPNPAAIAAMGSKIEAKRMMAAAGVPVLPGATVENESDQDPERLRSAAHEIGFPILVKAAFGGGGRGMRIVSDQTELLEAVHSARREAASAFGNGTVFLEKFVQSPRHIEVQIFGDSHGTVVHLGERECSIQRRYQKIIEESPSTAVDDALRDELGRAAVAAGKALSYEGAGTVEFVMAQDGSFYFLEVNTRLQVEHPVTELVTGIDLVRGQLLVAAGAPLPREMLEVTPRGHAVEVRLYAEDVAAGFIPASGTLTTLQFPELSGVRVDAGFASGSPVSTYYDPMLAKVIGYGVDRDAACDLLARALQETRVHGVTTNRDLLIGILREPEFRSGAIDTGYLERHNPAELMVRRGVTDTAATTHALVAALAAQADRRTHSPVLPGLPSGFRTLASAPQSVSFRLADEVIDVEYRFDRARLTARVGDWHPDIPEVHEATAELVDIVIDGVRRQYRIARAGAAHFVDSPLGATELHEVQRFPDPSELQEAGSLLAPMPGTVVRVDVTEGQAVSAGDPVVVLEAMKMQHTIRTPCDGMVVKIPVSVAAQVDSGQVLAIVQDGEGS